MNSDDTLIDLSAIWNVLWSGRWTTILFVTLGIICAGYLSFVRITPTYSASSVLVLETQKQKIDGIQEIVSELPLAGPSRELVLFTQLEVFRSRILMRSVVESIDLTTFSEFSSSKNKSNYFEYLFPKIDESTPSLIQENDIEFAVDRLLKQVRIELIPNSFAFKITAHSASPPLAQKIANAVSLQYIQAQLDNKSRATLQATQWLETRVTELQRDVAISEQRVKQFDARIDLLTEQDLKISEIKLKELRSRAKSMSEKRNYILHAKTIKDEDPTVLFKTLDTSKIPTHISTNNSSTSHNFDTQITNHIDTNLSSLNSAIETLAGDIQNQTTDLLELEQIKREADASKNLYEFFLSRLKETTIQQGVQRPDSRMLSMAVLPVSPSSPNKPLMLIMGALIGAVLAAIWLFLRHATRRSFLTPSELANAVDLPVFGVMPRGTTHPSQSKTREITIQTEEAARNLRTRLMTVLSGKTNPIIMCTASVQNEGRSQTALSLAQQLAALSKMTLLIDCDFRSISIQPLLQETNPLGLADVLSGHIDAKTAIINNTDTCDVLLSGETDANPVDLFAGSKFTALLQNLRKHYDFIILDTPPVLLFSDAGNIGPQCDATILNVGAGKTSRDYLTQSLEFLSSNSISVTGLVLGNYDSTKANNAALQREHRLYLRTMKTV
jgi:capsular exopolysaccharide synthesis family protein